MRDYRERAPINSRSVGTRAAERKRQMPVRLAPIQLLRDVDPRAYAAHMPNRMPAGVRAATHADLDALLALEEATFTGDRISRAQWRRHIASASALVLVSGAPGRVHAAAMVFYRANARVARLYSLAVAADRRGTGLGAAMLAGAEADAHRRGCEALSLEVRTDNAAAIALYERHGYQRATRLSGYYEDGADGWRYRKSLA